MATKQRPVLETLAADRLVFEQVQELLMSTTPSSKCEVLETARSGQGDILESMFGVGSRRQGGDVLDVARGGNRAHDQLDVALFKDDLPRDRDQLEAIIRVTGRPPLLVQNDNWADPVIPEIKSRLENARAKLQPCLQSVGRIDILTLNELTMVGTGWMVEEDILITNAHVADQFARPAPDGARYEFTVANDERVQVDLKQEHAVPDHRIVAVRDVLYMAPINSKHDIALLQVEKLDTELPKPLQLATKDAVFNLDIATIGYPAKDPYNDSFVMLNYFDNIYEVKRLSPGRIIGVENENWIEHDCTTLGGSSGSVVINLESGNVVGLHFAGSYKDRNLAVKSSFIKQQLAKI